MKVTVVILRKTGIVNGKKHEKMGNSDGGKNEITVEKERVLCYD